jgi:hypothetical protein
MPMSRFKVSWEIDIEAGTPEQAAQQALAIQRDQQSTATLFDVRMVPPCPSCKAVHVHTKQCRIFKLTGQSLLSHSQKVGL